MSKEVSNFTKLLDPNLQQDEELDEERGQETKQETEDIEDQVENRKRSPASLADVEHHAEKKLCTWQLDTIVSIKTEPEDSCIDENFASGTELPSSSKFEFFQLPKYEQSATPDFSLFSQVSIEEKLNPEPGSEPIFEFDEIENVKEFIISEESTSSIEVEPKTSILIRCCCYICHEGFINIQEMLNHFRVHQCTHRLENLNVNCIDCKKSFNTINGLLDHLKQLHFYDNDDSKVIKLMIRSNYASKCKPIVPKKGTQTCDVCFQQFDSKFDLDQHKSIYFKFKYGPYPCLFCSSYFKYRLEIAYHLVTQHFYCFVCEETCTSKKTLFNHHNKYHSKTVSPEDKSKSNFIYYNFQSDVDLFQKRTIQCAYCNSVCTALAFKTHLIYVHNIHTCDKCNLSFHTAKRKIKHSCPPIAHVQQSELLNEKVDRKTNNIVPRRSVRSRLESNPVQNSPQIEATNEKVGHKVNNKIPRRSVRSRLESNPVQGNEHSPQNNSTDEKVVHKAKSKMFRPSVKPCLKSKPVQHSPQNDSTDKKVVDKAKSKMFRPSVKPCLKSKPVQQVQHSPQNDSTNEKVVDKAKNKIPQLLVKPCLESKPDQHLPPKESNVKYIFDKAKNKMPLFVFKPNLEPCVESNPVQHVPQNVSEDKTKNNMPLFLVKPCFESNPAQNKVEDPSQTVSNDVDNTNSEMPSLDKPCLESNPVQNQVEHPSQKVSNDVVNKMTRLVKPCLEKQLVRRFQLLPQNESVKNIVDKTNITPMPCLVCGGPFIDLVQHMIDIHNVCLTCGIKFLNCFDLEDHTNRHLSEQIYAHKCLICDIKFLYREDIKTHFFKIHRYSPSVNDVAVQRLPFNKFSSSKKNQCLYCLLVFPHKDLLITHWQKVHHVYKCNKCLIHFHIHADCKDKHVKCKYCFEILTNVKTSNIAQSITLAVEKYECHLCFKIFSFLDDLKEHITSDCKLKEKLTLPGEAAS